jgi:two-component sensor histidine kinase
MLSRPHVPGGDRHDAARRVGGAEVVALGPFLSALCSNIGDALGCREIEADIISVDIATDMAVALALAVIELLTNAVKYGRAPYLVTLRSDGANLLLTVSDSGAGPAADNSYTGLGSHIVKTAARQLGAILETRRGAKGHSVEFSIPMDAKLNESSNRRG